MMEHAAIIRLACFGGILVLVALGERIAPRRVLTMPRPVRWLSNLGVVAVGALAVRLLFPFIGLHVALAAREQGWGLLNMVDLPRYGLKYSSAFLRSI